MRPFEVNSCISNAGSRYGVVVSLLFNVFWTASRALHYDAHSTIGAGKSERDIPALRTEINISGKYATTKAPVFARTLGLLKTYSCSQPFLERFRNTQSARSACF